MAPGGGSSSSATKVKRKILSKMPDRSDDCVMIEQAEATGGPLQLQGLVVAKLGRDHEHAPVTATTHLLSTKSTETRCGLQEPTNSFWALDKTSGVTCEAVSFRALRV